MDIHALNKAFDNRVRLGIMSVLMVNDKVEFKRMKELLNLTDGNLASHINALEKLEFIRVEKQFVGKKTQTTYQTTKLGKKAFKAHLKGLENLLRNTN